MLLGETGNTMPSVLCMTEKERDKDRDTSPVNNNNIINNNNSPLRLGTQSPDSLCSNNTSRTTGMLLTAL